MMEQERARGFMKEKLSPDNIIKELDPDYTKCQKCKTLHRVEDMVQIGTWDKSAGYGGRMVDKPYCPKCVDWLNRSS